MTPPPLIKAKKKSAEGRMTKRKKGKVKKKKSSKIKNAEPMDLASFEGLLSDMFGDSDEETPLRKAQDMMYDAWEVTDPKR